MISIRCLISPCRALICLQASTIPCKGAALSYAGVARRPFRRYWTVAIYEPYAGGRRSWPTRRATEASLGILKVPANRRRT
ncbi:hypothetical protein ACQKWADRAFT_279754 [Trichoderma austrokoningii]